VHAFKTRFSLAREELLRRDATAAARAQAGGQGDQAAGAGRGALQGLGGQEPRLRQEAQDAVESASSASRRQRPRPTVPRERRLELADGEIEAKVALRLEGLEVTTPDGPQADQHRPAGHRAGDRVALLGTNGAGKSTLLSSAGRAPTIPRDVHYDGQAAVRFNPACRLVYFDQTMTRPAAGRPHPRLPDRAGRRHRPRRRRSEPRQGGASPFKRIGEPIRC
jgi:ATPase subunit of ABC transporter with duplicated ATPase domains